MTKQVRIENADTSDHKVCVILQRFMDSGQWVDVQRIDLSHPTQMLTLVVHQGQRIIVMEDSV